jgi:hypothetical protein
MGQLYEVQAAAVCKRAAACPRPGGAGAAGGAPLAPEHLPEDKALALLQRGRAGAAAALLRALPDADSHAAYLRARARPAWRACKCVDCLYQTCEIDERGRTAMGRRLAGRAAGCVRARALCGRAARPCAPPPAQGGSRLGAHWCAGCAHGPGRTGGKLVIEIGL